MNWRWIVPVGLALAVIEGVMGMVAYNSFTWNWGHTKVLTGWDAVREVCLVFAPLILAGCGVFAALFIAVLDWASRGDR